uniref:Uncharacterized protein n=1 Tax=Physcomitrium patens TaxID=3218 RepID=A0A2K1KBE4_PHYPA|nr:hypothetical protein PHYPA_010283 [Physcomitrium patens]
MAMSHGLVHKLMVWQIGHIFILILPLHPISLQLDDCEDFNIVVESNVKRIKV